jgi:hypothetical protein
MQQRRQQWAAKTVPKRTPTFSTDGQSSWAYAIKLAASALKEAVIG